MEVRESASFGEVDSPGGLPDLLPEDGVAVVVGMNAVPKFLQIICSNPRQSFAWSSWASSAPTSLIEALRVCPQARSRRMRSTIGSHVL